MRYFTIFQDKLHLVNIQDEPNGSKISENFQNHPYGQLVLVSIVRAVSCHNIDVQPVQLVFSWAPKLAKSVRVNIGFPVVRTDGGR